MGSSYSQLMKLSIRQHIAINLKQPMPGLYGWFVHRAITRDNKYLEENAVKLLDIQHDHNVLEVGFGPGLGLLAAAKYMKDDSKGSIHGVEISQYMFDKAQSLLTNDIIGHKVCLSLGNVVRLPFNNNFFDRIFHCNCYYFWYDMDLAVSELYRVIKPGGRMVATLNLDSVKEAEKQGFLEYGNSDPIRYMAACENIGFEGVEIVYLNDEDTGKAFQAIYARVGGTKRDSLRKQADFSELSREEVKEWDERKSHIGN